jgi:hypothetical protein
LNEIPDEPFLVRGREPLRSESARDAERLRSYFLTQQRFGIANLLFGCLLSVSTD